MNTSSGIIMMKLGSITKFTLPNILKKKVIYFIFLLFLQSTGNVLADSLLDFNFKNNELTSGFNNWQYVDKGTNKKYGQY
jgi:hypothetical protein